MSDIYHQYDLELLHAERNIVLKKDGLTDGVICLEEAEVFAKKLLKAVKEINKWTDERMERVDAAHDKDALPPEGKRPNCFGEFDEGYFGCTSYCDCGVSCRDEKAKER